MKAFILDAYKKKGALRFGDMPEPELRDKDVLVGALISSCLSASFSWSRPCPVRRRQSP
jgi:hypothetical protein